MATPVAWRSVGGGGPVSHHAGTYDPPRLDKNALTGGAFHSTGEAPVSGQTIANRVAELKTFFGEPDPDRLAKLNAANYNEFYEQESYDYYDIFSKLWGGNGNGETRNGFLSRVIVEKTRASENWQLTRMAPWRYHPNGTDIAWNIALFNRHVLDREPEEAVPRLLTSTRTQGRASMVRYGLALLLEATFATTPEGRRFYSLNLEQIRVATVETASHGVMISLMEHEPYQDPFTQQFRTAGSRSKKDVTDMLNAEIRQWGIVHKSREGYNLITSRLKGILQRRNPGLNGAGDFTVVPFGMRQFVEQSADRKFYMDGPDARGRINIDGEAVVESREFTQGSHQPGEDPCFRHQTIGGFMTFDDAHLGSSDADVAKYSTDQMNAFGYDAEKDAFFLFRYRNLYRYAGVWNFDLPNAPLTNVIGRTYMYDNACYTWGQIIKRNTNYDRVVRKLMLLTPEKQQECLASLRLLANPETDPRVKLPNGVDYLSSAQFNTKEGRELFDAMGNSDVRWDKTYTIEQRRAIDRKRGRSGYADEVAEFDRDEAASKYARGNDGFALARPADRVDADGDVVMSATPAARTIRRPVDAIADLQSLTGPALHALAAEIVSVAAKTENDDAKEWTRRYTQAVVDTSDATLEQRYAILTELRRVVQGEVARLRAAGAVKDDEFIKSVVANFVPALRTYQTRIALAGVGVNRSLLEEACRTNPDLNAAFAADVVTPGWFNPSGTNTEHEDGQIGLAIGDGMVLPLPHDSFAATLAANYHVRFAFTNTLTGPDLVGRFEDSIGKGLKQSRADALAWSLALSVNAGGLAAAFGAANTKFLARLRRHAAAVDVETRGVLLAQEHLRAGIVEQAKMLKALVALKNQAEPAAQAAAAGAYAGAPMTAPRVSKAHAATQLEPVVAPAAGASAGAPINAPRVPNANATDFENAGTRVVDFLGLFAAYKQQFQAVLTKGYQLVPAAPPSPSDAALNKEILSHVEDLGAFNEAAQRAVVGMAKAVFLGEAKLHPKSWSLLGDTFMAGLPASVDHLLLSSAFGDLKAYYGGRLDQTRADATAAKVADRTPAMVNGATVGIAWTRAAIDQLLARASLISGSFYRFCVENDVPVPFFLRTWRPSKTFNMGSMLRMFSGENGAAVTFYQKPDFMVRAKRDYKACASLLRFLRFFLDNRRRSTPAAARARMRSFSACQSKPFVLSWKCATNSGWRRFNSSY